MSLQNVVALQRNEEGIAAAVEILKQRFGERAQTGQAIREQHGHTTTYVPTQAPDIVIFAHNTQDVQEVVRICAEHKVPVIAFGAGSSLEGQVNAPAGGVSIDLTQMNRVLAVHAEDLDCVIEPGITRRELNEYLRDTGLFFPIDPGANATLGGMASTRASGTNAVRYGTMRENVLALKAVMPDGRLIETSKRVKKTAAGYDLTRLLIGSEGTLGIITELTLKLQGIPQAVSGGICPFPDVESACRAVIETIQMGIPVARIELVNKLQMEALILHSKLPYEAQPYLFVEFHGTETGVAEQAEIFGEIAAENGGGEFSWTNDPEERDRLWRARHDAYLASFLLRTGAKGVSTDVCVPISRLADCIAETEKDLAESALIAPIVGHVGDGNFHLLLLLDTDDASEMERAEDFMDRLVRRAIAMEGTCTGEHGIGQGKMKYLPMELGEATDYMRMIKKAIDPDNIMNPGKILIS
ncbi:FAD-binding oxidoreductase [Brucella pseudogrignonensis]|uniref:D-lactate dehydrogenase (cytochrome) n=1 Tax=Brucella pseudogrignonensis TaxID=419475 RepID=A0A256GU02_9HYPH|nr:FAD-linked oxidase C-terminal domain-containing protein [Brucella pseudogrignonensis]MQP39108.1 FAD-binding protein [Ochrobactrum sp. MYb237]NNV22421.1 FAD-binding protein [Brucella pseudogrignonensis]OYR30236.1 FAD linked oxidase, C-terminal domain protein [Brucella pseudogrignonensis]PQZ43702.1 FAD-binding oxidoreductase [Brucella pseudogrignonensis]PRA43449.1 FAD-binding oxidoreductase [Brucella pseudogrignonensis]